MNELIKTTEPNSTQSITNGVPDRLVVPAKPLPILFIIQKGERHEITIAGKFVYDPALQPTGRTAGETCPNIAMFITGSYRLTALLTALHEGTKLSKLLRHPHCVAMQLFAVDTPESINAFHATSDRLLDTLDEWRREIRNILTMSISVGHWLGIRSGPLGALKHRLRRLDRDRPEDDEIVKRAGKRFDRIADEAILRRQQMIRQHQCEASQRDPSTPADPNPKSVSTDGPDPIGFRWNGQLIRLSPTRAKLVAYLWAQDQKRADQKTVIAELYPKKAEGGSWFDNARAEIKNEFEAKGCPYRVGQKKIDDGLTLVYLYDRRENLSENLS